MDLSFCESVIIKFLFTNEKLRERTIHYIIPEIFDDYNNISIVKIVKDFYEKFEKFPTIGEMQIEIPTKEVYDKLIAILNIDLTEYSDEYLLNQCETFIRQKLTINHFAECSMQLKEAKFDEAQQYPDKIRESLSFSFNTELGLDFLDDEERIFAFLHNKETVVPFGLKFLDQNTKGGAHEKSLVLFLAETNLGKTLILSCLAAKNIQRNKKVLYITCEMSEDKISERVLANTWDYDINELDRIDKEYFHNRFIEMKQAIQGSLQIKEFPPSTINPNHIRNLLKEYEVKKKFKPDIIYLDYLELVKPIYIRKSDNSYSECKRCAEEVRAIAVDYKIPIISALQTNREGFGSAEITLKNTADSIGLAFTGDVIFSVTQPPELVDANQFRIKILKNRYGLNKLHGFVNVDKPKMRISDCNNAEEEAAQSLRRTTTPSKTGTPISPIVRDALEEMNDTFLSADKASNESVFGDWE